MVLDHGEGSTTGEVESDGEHEVEKYSQRGHERYIVSCELEVDRDIEHDEELTCIGAGGDDVTQDMCLGPGWMAGSDLVPGDVRVQL